LPAQILERPDIIRQIMPIRNRADDGGVPADEAIGTEFLQLARFGLRDAEDPLILASIRVADALLKTETPSGPVWHRYNGDGYGEHDDGSAYDGTGRGRGWPLLTGERGHYELVAGRDPLSYLEAMTAMASPGGMMPEQVWDADPIPSRRLMPGRPTGSAMPLVWAHAEFIKLLISRQLGQPVDRPRAVWRRYRARRPTARHAFWWLHAPIDSMLAGARLAIALPRPAIVHWGRGGWREVADEPSRDSGLGFHIAALDLSRLPPGERVEFTWRWQENGAWQGRDYTVAMLPPPDQI
jgi:glucoamylase